MQVLRKRFIFTLSNKQTLIIMTTIYRVTPQTGELRAMEAHRVTAKSVYLFEGARRTPRMSGSRCFFQTEADAIEHLSRWYSSKISDLQNRLSYHRGSDSEETIVRDLARYQRLQLELC